MDRKDGHALWSVETVPDVVHCSYAGHYSMKPTLAENLVFFPTPMGNLYALAAQSGRVLWSFAADRGPGQDYSIGSLTVDENGLFFVGPQSLLYSLDPKSGALRWKKEVNDGEAGWDMTDTLAKVGRNLIVRAPNGRVACYDAATGARRWRQAQFIHHYHAAFLKGSLYAPYSRGIDVHGIAELDLDTGEVRRRIELPGIGPISWIDTDEEFIYVVDAVGVYQVDAAGRNIQSRS